MINIAECGDGQKAPELMQKVCGPYGMEPASFFNVKGGTRHWTVVMAAASR